MDLTLDDDDDPEPRAASTPRYPRVPPRRVRLFDDPPMRPNNDAPVRTPAQQRPVRRARMMILPPVRAPPASEGEVYANASIVEDERPEAGALVIIPDSNERRARATPASAPSPLNFQQTSTYTSQRPYNSAPTFAPQRPMRRPMRMILPATRVSPAGGAAIYANASIVEDERQEAGPLTIIPDSDERRASTTQVAAPCTSRFNFAPTRSSTPQRQTNGALVRTPTPQRPIRRPLMILPPPRVSQTSEVEVYANASIVERQEASPLVISPDSHERRAAPDARSTPSTPRFNFEQGRDIRERYSRSLPTIRNARIIKTPRSAPGTSLRRGDRFPL